ncbi:hypothetical protein J3A83DRAFT_4189781 [Scleroderma citrinum]
MTVKCHHHHSSSTSSKCTPAPPQKKPAMAAILSLNHDQLKEALQTGGASKFDVKKVFWQKIIQVHFYPIPTYDLGELIKEKEAFNIQSADPFSGNKLFSEGNVHKRIMLFENQYICNSFLVNQGTVQWWMVKQWYNS